MARVRKDGKSRSLGPSLIEFITNPFEPGVQAAIRASPGTASPPAQKRHGRNGARRVKAGQSGLVLDTDAALDIADIDDVFDHQPKEA